MATIDPHLATSDLGYMTAEQLGEALERGTLTSVEIVTGLLARIDAIDAPASVIGLRSILAVSDDAIAQAAAADATFSAHSMAFPLWSKTTLKYGGSPHQLGQPRSWRAHTAMQHSWRRFVPLVSSSWVQPTCLSGPISALPSLHLVGQLSVGSRPIHGQPTAVLVAPHQVQVRHSLLG